MEAVNGGFIRKLGTRRFLVLDKKHRVIGVTRVKHHALRMLRNGIDEFTNKKCMIYLPSGQKMVVKKIIRKDNDLVVIA